MIFTVTFNPAIDYVIRIGSVQPGAVNRALSEAMFFGGKGINVSVVLHELGVASKALGFTAGFTGEAIENGIRAMGIETDFVRLRAGNSRINVKIKADAETELNGQGPDIDSQALDTLLRKLDALTDGDTLVLAGSVPGSLPPDIYERILHRLSGRGIRFAVDAAGELLRSVLPYHPFLIKPNLDELGGLFGVTLHDAEDAAVCAGRLREMGAQNVLVSMAGDGALLLDEHGQTHRCGVCRGVVRNSVGAGDSMLAGFLAGIQTGSYAYALKLGTACGGATAFSDGLAKKAEIDALLCQPECTAAP